MRRGTDLFDRLPPKKIDELVQNPNRFNDSVFYEEDYDTTTNIDYDELEKQLNEELTYILDLAGVPDLDATKKKEVANINNNPIKD